MVRGDDYVIIGGEKDLSGLKFELEKKFDTKTSVIGLEKREDNECKVLNRVIRYGKDGIEYEPDQRHSVIVIEAVGLNRANAVITPGESEDKETSGGDEELNGEEMTRFRANAVRANYLAQDRSDIWFATKKVCRRMAKPPEKEWKSL